MAKYFYPLFVLAAVLGGGHSAVAQPVQPINYTLSFPAPQTHYVEVEARVPTGGRPAIEMMMAVWTPGSYLVREFARNVEAVSARTVDGKPLGVEKSRKNRWRVETGGVAVVTLSYRVYSREMSVRTSWVESEFALLNNATLFMTLADSPPRPHLVKLLLPPGGRRPRPGCRLRPQASRIITSPGISTCWSIAP